MSFAVASLTLSSVVSSKQTSRSSSASAMTGNTDGERLFKMCSKWSFHLTICSVTSEMTVLSIVFRSLERFVPKSPFSFLGDLINGLHIFEVDRFLCFHGKFLYIISFIRSCALRSFSLLCHFLEIELRWNDHHHELVSLIVITDHCNTLLVWKI